MTTRQSVYDKTAFSLEHPAQSSVEGSTDGNDASCQMPSDLKENGDYRLGEPQHEPQLDVKNDGNK